MNATVNVTIVGDGRIPLAGNITLPNGKRFTWVLAANGEITFNWHNYENARRCKFVCARYAAMVLAAIAPRQTRANPFAAMGKVARRIVAATRANAPQIGFAAYGFALTMLLTNGAF